MTLSSTVTRATYTGDGSTLAFPTTFPFFDADEIEVIERVIATGVETVKTLMTHYLVSGGAGSTGTVTAVTAPSSSVRWIIRRKTARTQEIDYTPNDPFPAETHERGLDRLKMNVQELGEELDRALKFPKTDSASISATIPGSVSRAGKVLAFDPTTGAPVVSNRTLAEMEQLSDSDAAESAAAAAASRDQAVIARNEAVAAAGSVNLPPIQALKLLVGNSGATGWDLKSFSELAALLAPYLTPFTTGDIKPTYKTVADSGWVMINDGTIGSASSGGTTRANADCEALYLLLWNNISNTYAPVSGGRGVSAAADWAANKPLSLAKSLGMALGVAGAGSGLTARALGQTVGTESVNADLLSHTHSAGTLAASAQTVTLYANNNSPGNSSSHAGLDGVTRTPAGTNDRSTATHTDVVTVSAATISGTTDSAGNSVGHPNMQPTTFLNVMIKL